MKILKLNLDLFLNICFPNRLLMVLLEAGGEASAIRLATTKGPSKSFASCARAPPSQILEPASKLLHLLRNAGRYVLVD